MSGSSLLPPNSTPTERTIEGLTAHVRDLPVAIRDLWNPASCPAAFLPWLAWALSVDTWRSDWPEATKRAVIAASPRIHRLKGTVGAVKAAVVAASGGAVVRVIEWFDHDGSGQPFTAVVEADITDLVDVSADLTADLLTAARSTAPARVHLSVRVALRSAAGVAAAAVINTPALRASAEGDARYVPTLRRGLALAGLIRRPLLIANLTVSGAHA